MAVRYQQKDAIDSRRFDTRRRSVWRPPAWGPVSDRARSHKIPSSLVRARAEQLRLRDEGK